MLNPFAVGDDEVAIRDGKHSSFSKSYEIRLDTDEEEQSAQSVEKVKGSQVLLDLGRVGSEKMKKCGEGEQGCTGHAPQKHTYESLRKIMLGGKKRNALIRVAFPSQSYEIMFRSLEFDHIATPLVLKTIL